MLDADYVQATTREWLRAWNAHDLDAVMRLYADQLEFVSPLIVERLGRADGTITRKDDLRDYFATGLGPDSDLHFEHKGHADRRHKLDHALRQPPRPARRRGPLPGRRRPDRARLRPPPRGGPEMNIEVVDATPAHKPVLASLLELYQYDFTEFTDEDVARRRTLRLPLPRRQCNGAGPPRVPPPRRRPLGRIRAPPPRLYRR